MEKNKDQRTYSVHTCNIDVFNLFFIYNITSCDL